MAKPIWYKGREYPTLKSLWEEHAPEGLSYVTFWARLKKGDNVFAALRPLDGWTARQVTIDGVTYATLKDAVDARGAVHYNTAYQRINRGWDEAKAVTTPPQNHAGVAVEIDGVEYQSLREAVAEVDPDLTMNGIRSRLNRGWTVADAVSEPPRESGNEIEVCGVRYPTIRAAWEAVSPEGLSVRRVYERLRVLNFGVDEAFLTPAQDPTKPRRVQDIVVDGRQFDSLKAAQEHYGVVCYSTAWRRIDSGWDVGDAVKTPPGETPVPIERRS